MPNIANLPYLNILTCLPTAVWVYDNRGRSLLWGNNRALEVWNVSSKEELRNHDFSYLPETAIKPIDSYLQQYENEFNAGINPLSHHTDVWTLNPKGMLFHAKKSSSKSDQSQIIAHIISRHNILLSISTQFHHFL